MSELPLGWNEAPLGTIADIRVSNVDKKTTPGEQHVRLCNYMDVYTSDYLDDARPYMEATASGSEIARFGLQRDDVLITKDSETPDDIAIPAVVDQDVTNLVCGYHLALLRPSGLLDGTWLSKQLHQARAQRYFAKMATGSTRYGLSNASIAEFPVWLPDLLEQKKASLILRTIDEAIRKTEQVIEKLKAMKQGLLHDLLTRGIDDNGELRPPPAEAPYLYKDSPLGMIPRGWEVVELGDVYSEASRNGLYKPSSYHGRGPLMIQMGNIFRGDDVDFTDAGRVQVSPVELRTYGLRRGDLLFGRRSLVLEGAGQCAFVRTLPEDATFESSIVRVRVDAKRLRPEYASMFLTSELAYLQRRKFIRQVAVSGVSGGDIAKFPVVVPPVTEQDRAVAMRTHCVLREEREEVQLAKLRTLKRGLMDDLLTGRVRVMVEEV